ncbi:LytR/AlgR family response regulator transcription factor [Tunicatimonas pelagia]|uniref:LytR/AlgR family response regulator transcription factor n=1 Tax=Tunicatimonas pelagia TaxID=931531 RepID=UPI0026657F63|nr:LytTR family DNA-binding domain-containing protein [Tunicatimonas pelagia]WKN43189.1 LytTR family DNA-binding domain-containing protein [Tunicatimonas pelagia]
MKCIAIDDEPLALSVIEDYVKRVPYLELIGAYENPFEALPVINQQAIDIVFIDINMPGLNGIDLVKSLQSIPQIIFTTAYSEYAIEGFELNATDYLLKPFGFDRFLKAINKANNTSTRSTTASVSDSSPSDFIFVHSEHHMIKISLADIHYIEGYKEYVKIHTNADRPILTIRSLKSLAEQLGTSLFIRIHKSYIIAIHKIQDIRNGKVKVKDKYLPIGESYKEVFNDVVLKGRI